MKSILISSALVVALFLCFESTEIDAEHSVRHSRSKEKQSANNGKSETSNSSKHENASSASKPTVSTSSISSSSSKNIESSVKSLSNDQKDFPLTEESNRTSKLLKRNYQVAVFEKLPDENSSIELELKSYVSPENASAVIELVPEEPVSENTVGSYNPIQNLPYYPSDQQINGLYYPKMNQYGYQVGLQYGVPYVPSEEQVLHPSFTNNYFPNLAYYIPYPIQTLPQEPKSARSPNLITSFLESSGLKSATKQEEKIEGKTPDCPRNVKITVNPSETTGQQQGDIYFKDLSSLISVKTGRVFPNNQNLIKIITPSYYLRTDPKVEWVPL